MDLITNHLDANKLSALHLKFRKKFQPWLGAFDKSFELAFCRKTGGFVRGKPTIAKSAKRISYVARRPRADACPVRQMAVGTGMHKEPAMRHVGPFTAVGSDTQQIVVKPVEWHRPVGPVIMVVGPNVEQRKADVVVGPCVLCKCLGKHKKFNGP
ncbi:hypothetical protein Tco_1017397 [Tanacetum coccineum]|uniref:Uncharacterized protein n=1 Tax=Tanacetum coccineum TaxID=301880 RepID=A0ABQ5FTY0_9ASTR